MVDIELTPGDHTIRWTLAGYDILDAVVNVSNTGVVTCINVAGGSCGGSVLPRVSVLGAVVTGYLIPVSVPTDLCTWIINQGGWNNLNWAEDVLQAYYVYIGVPGKTIGYSPVTWDSVLGLYYYYIGLKDMGNSKTGCAFL